MENIIVFGCGHRFAEWHHIISKFYNIIGIADNNADELSKRDVGNIYHLPIFNPHKICKYKCDFVLVTPEQNSENNSGNEPQPADTSNTQENTPEIINPDIDAANLANENNNNENNDNKNNSNVNENNNNLSNPAINSNPVINNAGTANPIKTYSNFNDAAKKIGYVPLYIPRKSGYTMDYIAVISDEIAEIRYGRRWEPTVTLSVRTYKRAAGEKLKDISGVYGVKWKIDTTSGTTIYIARISDTSSVAVWAVGQYTFAAMTENLSFAAFHSLIVEELVDLCNHYFIDV